MVGSGLGARVERVVSRHPVLTFVLFTFLLSYSVGLAGLIMRPAIAALTSSELAAQYLSRIGVTGAPALTALLITRACSGRDGVRALWRSFCPNRVWPWIGALVPAGVACAAGAAFLSGAKPAEFTAAARAWPLFGAHLVLQLLVIGCGEELGWRGWLLPQLLRRYRTGSATVLVAGIWGVWHVPILLTGLRPAMLFLFGVLGLSLLFTALWIHLDQNVFALAVAHASVNAPFAWLEEATVSAAMPSLHLQSAWETCLGIYGTAGLLFFVLSRGLYQSRFPNLHPICERQNDGRQDMNNVPGQL